MEKTKKDKETFGEKAKKAIHFMKHDIWRIPLQEVSGYKSFLIKQLRILILALRGFQEDNVLLRAPALTLYSLLGIVPVVALAFGIAQGFGLEMYVERQLEAALAGREEVYDWVMNITKSFLDQTHGGTMAIVGLVILLYTITMLLINIEESFNEIWQVSKGRSWSRKFSDYFSMMFIAPVFFILSSAVTIYLSAEMLTGIEETPVIGFLSPVLAFFFNLLPYVLIWFLFTALYMIMPNTSVKFSSALVAGIIAGTLFQLVQWAYIYFQIGVAKYGAIYGSFAALPLLLIWMQVSWMIVLFGAELSFANQNVESYEFEAESKNISPFNKKLLSMYILQLLIDNFQKGNKPLISSQISQQLQIPNSLVRIILNELIAVKLVNETNTDHYKEYAYQPAIDINKIDIKMVLDRLEKNGMDVLIAKPSKQLDDLKKSLAAFDRILEKSNHNLLLKDLS